MLARPGSVAFRNTPLAEVVFVLSEIWQVNIVASESVTGQVSGTFHNVPLSEVLSAVLTASQYSYRKMGSSLVVLPLDQIGTGDPTFTTQTLRLPSGINADEITEAAQLLLSERGQLRKVGTDAIVVVDSSDRIESVRTMLSALTPPVATAVPPQAIATPAAALPPPLPQIAISYFTPQYTDAEELAEPLRSALGTDAVVATFKSENRIMVKGNPDDLSLAADAIRQLDVPRPQVRITAFIYDVGIREIERLGVNWTNNGHSAGITTTSPSDPTAIFRNSVEATTGLITDPGVAGAANFAIRSINDNINAGILLQALDSTSESKLLADPSITVGDRHPAEIKIVQRIPTIANQPVGSAGVVFSQVEFEDAGVILRVTPHISRDGTIEMIVEPEYSVVVDFIDNNPVIDQRTAKTVVRVENEHMFVLGGLRNKSVVETVRGVPVLRDIRLIGKLFRSHDTEIRESELIVFLKPEIVFPNSLGTPRQGQAACITQHQLGGIAHADLRPMTPCCVDPNCPNHHPEPRINGGSRGLEMLGGMGIGELVVEGDEVSVEQVAPREVTSEEVTADECGEPATPQSGEPIPDLSVDVIGDADPSIAHPPIYVERHLP